MINILKQIDDLEKKADHLRKELLKATLSDCEGAIMTEPQARKRLETANILEMEKESGISIKVLYGWKGGSRKISQYALAFLSEYFKRKDQEREFMQAVKREVEKERKLWERHSRDMLDWRLRYFDAKPTADPMAIAMNEPNKPHYVTANND